MPKKAAGSSASGVAAIDSRVQGLIAEIDAEIGVLQQRKSALVSAFGGSAAAPAKAAAAAGGKRRGRPPGSLNKAKKAKKAAAPAKAVAAPKKRKKRVFSAETKAKLAASAKARWERIRATKG